jgi:hypothetical protein
MQANSTKTCSKCNQTLSIDNFGFTNKSKGYRRGDCKECCKKISRSYYKSNRKKLLLQKKSYAQTNKEKIAEKNRTYRQANKESLKEYTKNYIKTNKEKITKQRKAFREANREKLKKKAKEYYEANKEKIAAKAKKFYKEKNKAKILERQNAKKAKEKAKKAKEKAKKAKEKERELKKAYREKTSKQRERERKQAYYKKNKEKILKRCKTYREANKEKIADYHKAYFKVNSKNAYNYISQRRKSDPLFRLNLAYRRSCYRAFQSIGDKKNNKSLKLLGLKTWQELSEHLSKQFYDHPKTGEKMTFEKYGYHGWHIDHIIPLSTAETEEDVIKLCHYTNLQPLWAQDNLSKGNKIIKKHNT